MEVARLVEAFNNLPRPETTPSGLPNHWYFVIRHVPFDPPGDLVQVFHPPSRFIHCAGPRQILSLPTRAAQADHVAALIVESFVSRLHHGPDGQPLDGVQPFAPWTWATEDVDLARAVEAKLAQLEIRGELCTVRPGSRSEVEASDTTWAQFLDTLEKSLGRDGRPNLALERCGGCKQDASAFSTPLRRCARCQKTSYCSRQCQQTDWSTHKTVCRKDSETSSVDPLTYYNNIAHTVLDARDLATSLNLTLPTGRTDTIGLMCPIRRLIIAGQDSPKNLQLLLGSSWKSVQATISEARMDVLLRAPPGSPSYACSAAYDNDAPPWSPRPPTPAEHQTIEKVREMQAQIRRQLGTRKEPTTQDMQAVLLAFGREWDSMLPIYTLAINALDQGVTYRARHPTTPTATTSRNQGRDEEPPITIPDICLFTPPSSTDTPRSLFPCRRQPTRKWPRFAQNHRDFLVYTDGACLNNGQPNAVAGWGFIFRASDPDGSQIGAMLGRLEDHGPSGQSHPHTSNRAELRAVIAVLQCREWLREGWTRLVIAADSEYVTKGATEWVRTWGRNGWKSSKGFSVKNQDLWQELLRQVVRHRQDGLDVCFWHIPRDWNTEADSAAKQGATKESREHFDRAIGVSC